MNNYIKPTTKVIAVYAQQIMNTVSGVDNLNFNPNEETTSMDAKGGLLWDDDESDPSGVPGYNIWEE